MIIRMQKKRLSVLLALALFFIGGCSITGKVTYTYDFEDGFNELLGVDKKHNTDWYTKNINTSQWLLEEIDVIKEDYVALRNKFNTSNSISQEDREALLLLMEFETNNIEGTKYFKLKNTIGSRGTVRDGFKCSDGPFVLMAVQYFNISHQHLLKARYAMDKMLTRYPQTRPVIDMENHRPIIMDPPFEEILLFIEGETRIINQFCPMKKEGDQEDIGVTTDTV